MPTTMKLCDALQVAPGDLISIVGAGGKTGAMCRLASELDDQGLRVVVTTTTMIRPPSTVAASAFVVEEDAPRLLKATEAALRDYHVVVVARSHRPDVDKLRGIAPSLVDRLCELSDVTIVEADGAKGLSLKAPAAHEPVIPSRTSLLVAVAAVDAVGRPLTDQIAHRPELVGALAGIAPGSIIDPSTVAMVLTSPQGGLKCQPADARGIALLNKVEDDAGLRAGREVARQVLSGAGMARVVLAAVAASQPVVECWRRVAAVVLAAGGSLRMGVPKQLLPCGQTTLLGHVLRTVELSGALDRIVVVGHRADEVLSHVPPGWRTVVNRIWEDGLSSSVKAGLAAVGSKTEAVLFVLADQPGLRPDDIRRILYGYYASTRAIVVPEFGGKRGNPVLFDRRMFARLLESEGDVGGRELIRRFPGEVETVPVTSPSILVDVDTKGDWDSYCGEHADKAEYS